MISTTTPTTAAAKQNPSQHFVEVDSAGNGSNGNLVLVSGASGNVQLNSLTQVTFGGVAFNPGAGGLPTHQ